MLAIGDYAPTLPISTYTDMFSLAEQGGKKVFVFFFSRAETPGCTKEAEQFSAPHDEFTAQNTVEIGVSKDKPAKQAKFRAKLWPDLSIGRRSRNQLLRRIWRLG